LGLNTLKNRIKEELLTRGYAVHRVEPEQIGIHPYRDMRRLTGSRSSEILFDVGANRGQSLGLFRENFPTGTIHAFEPSPSVFEELKQCAAGETNVRLNNIALGSSRERRILNENPQDSVSSLLPADSDFSWRREIRSRTEVEVSSVDDYCESAGIKSIDVLKSDTQGFDLEVLKGATRLLNGHKIHLVYVEMNFLNIYVGMASFEDIFLFLKKFGFETVSFYNMCYQGGRLGWLDGLFIDPNWIAA